MGDIARVQVIIPYTSGVPGDVVTNTLYFEALDGELVNSTHLGALFTVLDNFYEAIYTATANKNMAGYMKPSDTVMKGYNMSDPLPRTAVRESIVPLTVGTQINGVIPSEASAVLSYHTEYQSGIPKASQRGRIYLGGLGDACFEPGTISNSCRLKSGFMTAATGAADTMAAAALSADWGWSVWSDKRQEAFAVAGGWMDNAIDTQRRRGQAATTRLTFAS